MLGRLGPAGLARIDALLAATETAEEVTAPPGAPAPASLTLHDLKAAPGRMRLAGVLTRIGRPQRVRQVALPHDLFADVAPSVVQG